MSSSRSGMYSSWDTRVVSVDAQTEAYTMINRNTANEKLLIDDRNESLLIGRTGSLVSPGSSASRKFLRMYADDRTGMDSRSLLTDRTDAETHCDNGQRFINGISEDGFYNEKGELEYGTREDTKGREFGMFRAGELHGQGRRTLCNGIIEEGNFEAGELHGFGCRTNSYDRFPNRPVVFSKGIFEKGILVDGHRRFINARRHRIEEHGSFSRKRLFQGWRMDWDSYTFEEGTFNEVNELHGQGKRRDKDSTVEEGEFRNGQLQGQGTRTFRDGTVEKGEFQNGRLHGKGEIRYLNGDYAEGEFKDGRIFNGDGIFQFHYYGIIESGHFEKGQLQGRGSRTIDNWRTEIGIFINGRLHGEGKIIHRRDSSGEEDVFEEGIFKEGWLRQGIHREADGTVEEGEFREGQLHGQGKRTLSNKTVEEGEFREGQLHRGKRTFSNKIVEEGEFENGQLHGHGIIRAIDGSILCEGIFEAGHLISRHPVNEK